MSQIVTGLASFGMSGKIFHAPLLHHHPQFLLKKIVERSKNEASKIYPGTESVKSFDDLVNDPDIELIIVNTPDNTHYEFSRKALEGGKHIVVEKPFTQTVEEGEELITIASKQKLQISVFQNRRWDGDFLTVKKVIENGLVGRLVEFESHFDRYRNYIQPGTWKEDPGTGTGTLYNLGSHMIDQALCLFGMPEAVHADIRILRTGGKVDDSYDLKLYYKSVKVTLKGSYLVREPGPRYILHGTSGSFLKYGLDPQEEDLKAGKPLSSGNWGKDPDHNWGILNSDINSLHHVGRIETIPGNYMAFYDNIYQVLRHGVQPEVKAIDALNVIKVIQTSLMSNQSRQVIEL